MHYRVVDSTSIVNIATIMLYISLRIKKHKGMTNKLLIHRLNNPLLPTSGIQLHSPLKSILVIDCGMNCGKDEQVDFIKYFSLNKEIKLCNISRT